jgi:type I restriction enzyme S subunit
MHENWKTYKLGEIADVQNGYAFKSNELVESGIPVIKIKNIVPPNISLEGAGFYNEEIDEKLEKYIIKRGDFLISMTGSTVNVMSSAVGKMGRYRLDDLALLNQRAGKIYVTQPKKLDFDYLCHFLSRYVIHYNLALNATGSANQANISPSQIKDIELNLPPLPEQTQIANILSAIDDKIENNLAINKTLEDMAMALYKHWFVDFGPFQEGEFIDSELGLIPKGWEVKRLDDFINLNPRLTIPKSAISSYVEMKVLPINLMSVSNVAKKEFKGGSKFQNDDTLFARITPCLENGKMAFVDFLKGDEIAFGSTEFLVMRAKQGVSKYWVYCLAKDSNFRKFSISTMVGSSGRQRVQNDPFLSFELAKPSSEIFNSFSKTIEPWFSQVRLNTFANQSLTKLRDTLLPKLVSGEVRLKEFREGIDAEINSA